MEGKERERKVEKEALRRTTSLLSFDTEATAWQMKLKTFFTKPFLSNERGYTHRHTRPHYYGFQELGKIHRQQGNLISLLFFFFQNKELA
jgi:hypothetical protein